MAVNWTAVVVARSPLGPSCNYGDSSSTLLRPFQSIFRVSCPARSQPRHASARSSPRPPPPPARAMQSSADAGYRSPAQLSWRPLFSAEHPPVVVVQRIESIQGGRRREGKKARDAKHPPLPALISAWTRPTSAIGDSTPLNTNSRPRVLQILAVDDLASARVLLAPVLDVHAPDDQRPAFCGHAPRVRGDRSCLRRRAVVRNSFQFRPRSSSHFPVSPARGLAACARRHISPRHGS